MNVGHHRAARYLRVSRSDQVLHLQADETKRLIGGRGWQLVDTYADHGESGASSARKELRRMMADARRGRFDVLVVWRSDRLFRSLKDMVTTLEELAALNIGFVSVTEPLDSTTPQGRLLTHLVSAFAEFERALLVERTKAGMEAARRRGARIGRPPVTVSVSTARLLRAQGVSMKEIARRQGVGLTTLRRALKDAEARGLAVATEPPRPEFRGEGS